MPSHRNITTGIAASVALLALLAAGAQTARAQQKNAMVLDQLSKQYRAEWDAHRGAEYLRLINSTDPAMKALNEATGIQLMFIRDNGMPAFFKVDNLNAAKTVRTYDVWPAPVGLGAYNATGSTTAAGELAIWDGGGVLTTHQEFGGRVTKKDGAVGSIDHATHVSGTLIAAGVNSAARGMSYEALLDAYEWTNDTSEMATAAANGLQVSNHSYGFASGWEGQYWYGDLSVSTTEDYGFGFYDSSAREYDQIMYNAPDYLIVVSSGNDRNDAAPGGSHYHWSGGWVLSNDAHGNDYQNGGYDTISWTGNAKNPLLVGAVNDIPAGYSQPSNVVQAPFSSWGPTDDGRIKPDIVANGVSLTSSTNVSNTSYAIMSGTSMASPNAAGSVNLIAHEFETVRGTIPWSSTVKAIVINAADEAGIYDGPDFQNGWGLLNTHRSFDIIHAAAGDNMGVIEANLPNGQSKDYYFVVTTPADIRVTLVWTDPPGSVGAPALDNSARKLVNDLDLSLEEMSSGTTTSPWTLSLALPGNAPTKGPNHVDNVEEIDLPGAAIGAFKVTVSHTGALTNGSQNYSLVYRGMHEAPTPVSGPAHAPSFWIGDPRPNPVAGTATIDFGNENAGSVSVYVYDVSGHRVATLLQNSTRRAGTLTFDSSRLASGVYFVRMESGAQTSTRKITIVK